MDYAQIVDSAKSFECGTCCKFVRISKDKGIKVYDCEYLRDKTYNLQMQANLMGLAPKVFEKFQVGDSLYGYVTETVYVFDDLFIEYSKLVKTFYKGQKIPPAYRQQPIFEFYVDYITTDEIDDIIKQLSFFCWGTFDTHSGNYGIDNNGNIVCIDFSELYFENENEDSEDDS